MVVISTLLRAYFKCAIVMYMYMYIVIFDTVVWLCYMNLFCNCCIRTSDGVETNNYTCILWSTEIHLIHNILEHLFCASG